MTTIATDGKTMAADSRVMNEANTILYDTEPKLAKTKKGWVIGISGNGDLLRQAVEAFDAGKDPTLDGDSTLLALLPGGELRRYGPEGWSLSRPPDAIGSGHRFAFTAMDCGKSPEEAVRLAIMRDPFSGGEVQVMTPGPEPKSRRGRR